MTTIHDSSNSLSALIESNNENTRINGNYEDSFAHILAAANLATQKKAVTLNAKTKNQITQQSVKSTSQTANTKKVATNPNAAFVATGGQVVVTVKKSDSDNINRIYWSTDNFKTRHYISTDNQTGNFNIGTFAAGTPIEFGIDNGKGDFYRTGAAGFNSDGTTHAIVTKSKNVSSIGFEDAKGGGDYDFNDVILNVTNKPKPPDPTGGGGSGGGGYPVIKPDNPVDVGGSIQIGGNIVDWLKQLGLQGDDLNIILALLSQSNPVDLNDILKKLKALLGSDKSTTISIFDLLNVNKNNKVEPVVNTQIELNEINTVNKPIDLSQLDFTIKKIKDMTPDELETIGLKQLITIDSGAYNPTNYNNENLNTNNVDSVVSSFYNNLTAINTSDFDNTNSNKPIKNLSRMTPTTSSVEIKLLNAIYRSLG